MGAAYKETLKSFSAIFHFGEQLKGGCAADATQLVEIADDMTAGTLLLGKLPAFRDITCSLCRTTDK